MKKVELVNGSKLLNMKASAFIIPNSLAMIKDYIEPMQEKKLKCMEELCNLNGTTFDPESDKIVEMWFHSEDVECDNLHCHGFSVEELDGSVRVVSPAVNHIPVKLVKERKEGDTFTFKVQDEDLLICMELTLDQTHYRYRQFGPFEECLQSLLDSYVG